MQWNHLSSAIPTTTQELLSIVLNNRSIEDIDTFLHPVHPETVTLEEVGLSTEQMQKAIKRLREAKEKEEKIIIFGDYDCDGVCATTVLWETMYEQGYKVMPFIPHREHHGYGLSSKALDEILSKGVPAILISVDNGIVAHAQWQRLKDEGVYTILTDHHQPDEKIPVADVVIHSTKLCGTTVAWMLARELHKEKASSLLDLCAIATIADQVPLLSANRSFAKYGIEMLNHTTRLGLQLLIEASGLQLGSIDATSINYGIAPRINAIGRLESALDALRALCARKEEVARELIGKLATVNQTRQDLTQHLIEKAMERASEWEDEHIIIVDDPEFHEGIIGLIASKLTEKYFKPTVCISRGELTSKASCRSITGVHITNLLRSVKEDLLEVGGHPLAAGFKIETSKIPQFKERLRTLAREQITKDQLIPHIDIDCEIPGELLTLETATALEQLEPYGSFNRAPVFSCSEVDVVHVSSVGKEGKHLKLEFIPKGQATKISAIGFSMGQKITQLEPHQQNVSISGVISVNEWKERKSVQMMLKHVQITKITK